MSALHARPARRPASFNIRTYKAAVYESLLRMIGELELPPGRRLVEEDLANRFDVSKTPVREALLLLEADGVVQLERYRGATVTWLSLQEYQELLFMQDALEQAALPMVVEGITPRDLDVLGDLMERVRRKRQDHDSYGFSVVGAQVHERLFTVAHSPRLIRAVMSLITGPTRRYEKVFMHQFDDTWDLELSILEGRVERIRAGDPEGAAQHVRQGRARMLELIRQRLDDPSIAPYLAPAVPVRPRRIVRRSPTSPRG
jgi:DNA-binding GntR family transcriptional regulator